MVKKTGRPKAFENPEQLWTLFELYKKWVKKNPFLVHDFVGKDATEVRKQRERPITWVGFESWLCQNDYAEHLGHYEQNTGKNGNYDEFMPTIARIKKQCRASVVDGALANVFNPNIAARVEGLKEVSEIDINANRKAMSDMFPLED